MRTLRLALPLLAILASPAVFGQTPPPPETTPETPPSTTPGVDESEAPPATLSDAASGTFDRRENFPNVNIYLPEGEATIRLRRLIRNVLFETQIDYEFVNGDISTFLRYKYYARNYTYRIGVFDEIKFPDIGETSAQEFERVRGGLLLIGVPKDYSNRYFFLLQNDRLTFGDTDDPDNRKNNIYAKIGYQYGTQFDERMNAIVSESRGRIAPVLTAFRDIGPQRTGLAAAITQAARVATGDYHYTKFEAEALRRFDLTSTSFIFSRLHLGAFINRQFAEHDLDNDGVPDDPETLPEVIRYTVPRYEMFRLGGREAMKSISSDDASIGTHEIHLTNELFTPIFRNRNYKTGALHWNTLYGIGYVGAGTVGFDFDDITDTSRFVIDAGIGTEAALSVRDFEVYLSVVVAHTIDAPEDVGGTKVRFSIRTIR